MGECVLCDGDEHLPNRCRYCNRVFCTDHRLPEAHDCPGLEADSVLTKHFESSFDDDIGGEIVENRDEKPYEVVEPETYGTTPEPDYGSSPDVNLDGSIASADEQTDDETTDEDESFVSRLLSKFF